MQVGDKVFIGHSWGTWGRPTFTPATVNKITPSGLIDLEFGTGASVTRFSKDLKEFGRRYRGDWIDQELPYEDRAAWQAQQDRIAKAVVALRKVSVEFQSMFPTKDDLILERTRIAKVLEDADTLIALI